MTASLYEPFALRGQKHLRDKIGELLLKAASNGRSADLRSIVGELIQANVLLPVDDLFVLVRSVAEALEVRFDE